MSGILRLESLTKGNTLKQGDKTPLKYRLFDADGEKLIIAGKSAKVRLVYPDFLTIGYEKDGLTVAQDDTVTFTIDNVIPSRIYHVEIIVDDKFIFPSRADESKFTVDKSSLGTETNIIEIVGKDILIRDVRQQVEAGLQPMVDDLTEAEDDRVSAENARQQNEANRNTAESSRVSAEAQRKTDHANRSAEFDGKADKVVLRNLIENGGFLNGTTGWLTSSGYNNRFEVVDGVARNTETDLGNLTNNNRSFVTDVFSIPAGHKVYSNIRFKISDLTKVSHTQILYGISGADGSIPISVQGTDFNNYSGLLDWKTGARLRIIASFNSTTDIPEMYLDYAMLLDLTEIFGTGNEPTKEEMDELIKVTGYIDGEYALNNKEMLIWTLALIRRNKNAIISLGGA